MSLELFFFFSNADAQLRANPLTPQQPPECKRFRQTRRMNQPAPVRGMDHLRGHRGTLVHKCRILFLVRLRKKSLQRRLCCSKTAPPQAQGYQRQQHHGAQKKFPCRKFHPAKSLESFPHQRGELGASRSPRAAPRVPLGWSGAIPVRRRIPQGAPDTPHQYLVNPSRAATFVCRSSPNQSTAQSRDSAKPILDPESAPERALALWPAPQMTPSARLLCWLS